KERHIAAPDEPTSALATKAAREALKQANISPEELDLILVATVTPDTYFPSTACYVQRNLGAKNAVCFDISAACSDFLYAVQTARHFINTGNRKTVLVIGAEKLSSIVNWEDRNTCVLFGDGAGAVVLQRRDEESADLPTLLSSIMASDGELTDILVVPGGGSACPITQDNADQRLNTISMQGREVYKHAVTNMARACGRAISEAGLTAEDIDLVIPHQANRRIIDAIIDRLKLPKERAFVNLHKYGNTSAASIGIALDEANRTGAIKRGDHILLVAFGAGLTWAATVIRW
ncbi:MAG: ketoacyl-ACP synthase III, partial [Verrucomicrobiales bacterium]|nr:ketoacyl-ACP synthase III [Verrucomicrobiales bacterium]